MRKKFILSSWASPWVLASPQRAAQCLPARGSPPPRSDQVKPHGHTKTWSPTGGGSDDSQNCCAVSRILRARLLCLIGLVFSFSGVCMQTSSGVFFWGRSLLLSPARTVFWPEREETAPCLISECRWRAVVISIPIPRPCLGMGIKMATGA